jgi:hypothetical protein
MPPISGDLLNDPGHWRERAKQLRADAGATPYQEETRILLELAEMHDKFAADIEARQISSLKSLPGRRAARKVTNKNEKHPDE